MAKKTSFKDKKPEELKKLLGERREELRQLRFNATGARAKDVNAAKKVRKDIARLLTEQTIQKKTA
ncbi:MAG TPA: 50S ribosomal protein L29 [Candidatus Paceibacterota bacterium]|nr:50S ribosomal protein L29 [Candidatus Paceibacterota bacterium]